MQICDLTGNSTQGTPEQGELEQRCKLWVEARGDIRPPEIVGQGCKGDWGAEARLGFRQGVQRDKFAAAG